MLWEHRFWFMLAGHLAMTVREAMQRITSAEFTEWMAFYELSPWADDRRAPSPAEKAERLSRSFAAFAQIQNARANA